MGIGMQSILKVCVANSGDRLRWMSRRKALAITKVGLLVCLAVNFRKTQTSARFVAMAIPKIRSGFGGEYACGHKRLCTLYAFAPVGRGECHPERRAKPAVEPAGRRRASGSLPPCRLRTLYDGAPVALAMKSALRMKSTSWMKSFHDEVRLRRVRYASHSEARYLPIWASDIFA